MANEAAVATRQATVADYIVKAKTQITARLPKGMDQDRFMLGIMTAIQKNPNLLRCNPQSVLLAAYDAAECGCSLSPALQLGWLIPYGQEAQFQPSYRFFIQKAYETGDVKTFFAEVVYQGDEFTRQFAPKRNLFHAPKDGVRNLSTRLGAYAFIEFNDGVVDWEYLTNEQIDRHRNASKNKNSMKWQDFWEEGWRITPIRVLAKRLPLRSRNFESLIELANADTERDLVIPVEEILEPSVPRKMEQKPAETKPETKDAKPETKVEEKTETVAAEETKQAPAETTQQSAQQSGSMFAEGDDPFVTTEEIQQFWPKALGMGWKKSEVQKIVKDSFNVEHLKDLKRSQFKVLIGKIESGT